MSHLQLYWHTERGQGWRPSTGTANLSNFHCMTAWEKVDIYGGSCGGRVSLQVSVSYIPSGTRQVEESSLWAAQKWQSVWKLKAAKRRFQTKSSVQVPEQPLITPAGCSAFLLRSGTESCWLSSRAGTGTTPWHRLRTRWVPSHSNISPATTELLERSAANEKGVTYQIWKCMQLWRKSINIELPSS